MHDLLFEKSLGARPSHHVRTNMSVRRGIIFEALAYIANIREMCYFSIGCTYKKAIKYFEVKVDVQKWALRFRKETIIDVFLLFN